MIADAENNVAGENLVWESDKSLEMVAVLNPTSTKGCTLPLPDVGTTTVTCTGAGAGGPPYNGVLVGAETPSRISLSMSTFARSGVAFAIQTACLTLEKSVVDRVGADDSFDLSIVSPEGTVVGSASTGTASSASTGSVVVLPRVGGAAYTLAETATPGSPTVLSNYAASWTCVNSTPGSPTVLPSGSGSSVTVVPAAGDDIRCTIGNTGRARSIGLVKSAGAAADFDGDGLVEPGDRIPYTFRVENSGELPLSGVSVNDPLVGGVLCPPSTLVPGAAVDCTGALVLTQAQIDAGEVANIAMASAFPPGSSSAVVSSPSTAVAVIPRRPALTMVKSAEPSAPADFEAGETIQYSFVITNTGNVTITGIAVDDSAGFSGTGPLASPVCDTAAASLAPGQQVLCSTSYVVTQDDVDSGSITNTARATGTPPSGAPPIVTTPSTATVPQPQAPALSIGKTADRATVSNAGEVITYSFAITNTGNVTLRSVGVEETAFNGSGGTPIVDCPPGASRLLPGQVIVCRAEYRAAAADLTGTALRNTAVATAAAGGSTMRSLPSTVTLPTADLRPVGLSTTGSGVGSILGAGVALLGSGFLALGVALRRRRATHLV